MMFDIESEKLTIQQILSIAKRENLNPLRVAINNNGFKWSVDNELWSSELYTSEKFRSVFDVAVLDIIMTNAAKFKFVYSVDQLVELINKQKEFKGKYELDSALINGIFPELERMGCICSIKAKIYVNPVATKKYVDEKKSFIPDWYKNSIK